MLPVLKSLPPYILQLSFEGDRQELQVGIAVGETEPVCK